MAPDPIRAGPGRAARTCTLGLRVRRTVALPPPPPAHVRRRRRAGARRAHAAQRGRAGQGPPRLPVRRLARDRQDLDGEDPRRAAELRERADDRALRRLRVLRRDRRRHLDRRDRDGRRLATTRSTTSASCASGSPSRPVAGRWKVYILDEAHMLTTQAWNAFLKTLEEPPPHTIFVLATTEAHKVLPTVVDRCQRFDFGRPDGRAARRRSLRRVADAGGRSRSTTDAVGADRPLGDRHLPRRARHARAARHLLGDDDRGRATCSRCSASPTPTCSSARSTRSPPDDAAGALRVAAAARRRRPRPRVRSLRDLEVAHPRAARRPHARRGARPSCASRPSATPASPSRPQRRRRPATSSACSSCSPWPCARVKDGADPRTRLELALVQAAHARGRRVDEGAARADRAAGGAAAGRRRPRPRPSRRRVRAPCRAAGAAAAPAPEPPPAPAQPSAVAAVPDPGPPSPARRRRPPSRPRPRRSRRPSPVPPRTDVDARRDPSRSGPRCSQTIEADYALLAAALGNARAGRRSTDGALTRRLRRPTTPSTAARPPRTPTTARALGEALLALTGRAAAPRLRAARHRRAARRRAELGRRRAGRAASCKSSTPRRSSPNPSPQGPA